MIELFSLIMLIGFLSHVISTKYKIPFIASVLFLSFIANQFFNINEVENLSLIGGSLLLYSIGLEMKELPLQMMPFIHALLKMTLSTIILFYFFIPFLDSTSALTLAFSLSISSTAAFNLIVKREGWENVKESKFLLKSLIWEDVFAVLAGIAILSTHSPFINVENIPLALLYYIGLYIIVKTIDKLLSKEKEPSLFFHLFVLFSTVSIFHKIKVESLSSFIAGFISSKTKSIEYVKESVDVLTKVFILFFFFSIGINLNLSTIPLSKAIVALISSIVVKSIITAIFLIYEKATPYKAAHLSLLFSTTGEFSLVLAVLSKTEELIAITSFVTFFSLLLIPITLSLSNPFSKPLRKINLAKLKSHKTKRKKWKGWKKKRF